MKNQNSEVSGSYKQALNKTVILMSVGLSALTWWGCGKSPKPAESTGTATSQAPDYKKASSWVSQPTTPDKPIDVFYVYPTIFADKTPPNMDINNTVLRGKAEYLIHAQAGVFAESANIFAPFYRQMSMAQLNPKEDMYTIVNI